jgi:hypothetical protein
MMLAHEVSPHLSGEWAAYPSRAIKATRSDAEGHTAIAASVRGVVHLLNC